MEAKVTALIFRYQKFQSTMGGDKVLALLGNRYLKSMNSTNT